MSQFTHIVNVFFLKVQLLKGTPVEEGVDLKVSLNPLQHLQGLIPCRVFVSGKIQVQPNAQLLSKRGGDPFVLCARFIQSDETKGGVLTPVRKLRAHLLCVKHLCQDGRGGLRQSLCHGAKEKLPVALRQKSRLLDGPTLLQGHGQIQSAQQSFRIHIGGQFACQRPQCEKPVKPFLGHWTVTGSKPNALQTTWVDGQGGQCPQ